MGRISVFTGNGHGKSPAAIGEAFRMAVTGKSVIIIQFLKGKGVSESELVTRLEPEVKIFRFEKSDTNYDELPKDKKEEEIINIKNGINFARKVITTGSCDLLVLDELLGLIDNDIVSSSEIIEMLELRPDNMDIILTGITINDDILSLADDVTGFTKVK